MQYQNVNKICRLSSQWPVKSQNFRHVKAIFSLYSKVMYHDTSPLNILFNLNLKNQRKDGFWLLTGHLLSSTDFVYILIFKIQSRPASCIQTDMFHRNINGNKDEESLEVNSRIILPHNALDIMIYTYATRLASEASCVKMRSLNLM